MKRLTWVSVRVSMQEKEWLEEKAREEGLTLAEYVRRKLGLENRSGNPMPEVRIPQDLIERIRRLIVERPELGYLDEEEFIRDALRRFLFPL